MTLNIAKLLKEWGNAMSCPQTVSENCSCQLYRRVQSDPAAKNSNFKGYLLQGAYLNSGTAEFGPPTTKSTNLIGRYLLIAQPRTRLARINNRNKFPRCSFQTVSRSWRCSIVDDDYFDGDANFPQKRVSFWGAMFGAGRRMLMRPRVPGAKRLCIFIFNFLPTEKKSQSPRNRFSINHGAHGEEIGRGIRFCFGVPPSWSALFAY